MKPSILCPVDFSAPSRSALRHASSMAAKSRGRLTVLFVEDPLLFAANSAYDEPQARADLLRKLRTFVKTTLRPPRNVDTGAACEIAVGNPAIEIQRAARRLGSNLIVMGSHGLTGAMRMVLGSTTDKVLRRAHVPVLAIPLGGRAGLTTLLAGARTRA
jgi:nucleotide-binding universal stress UspA family protein